MLEAMTHFNLSAFTHLFSEGEVMGPFSRPRVSQSYVLPCDESLTDHVRVSLALNRGRASGPA